jgi:hypothetical protein
MTSVSIEWEPDVLSAEEKREWQATIEAVVADVAVGSFAARFALKEGTWVLYNMSCLVGYDPDSAVTLYNDKLGPKPANIIQALSARGKDVRIQWGPRSAL